MRRDGPTDGGPVSGPVWFVGDLRDSWVAGLADALPSPWRVVRFDCPGELPDDLADRPDLPAVMIVHRGVLTRADAERLARLRSARGPVPRLVLCYGPHVRQADLERWVALVDAAVPEATASETLASWLSTGRAGRPRASGARRARPAPIVAVSTNGAFRQFLVDAVTEAGFSAVGARGWDDAPAAGPAIWDVPVLEPGWPEALSDRVRRGPVVALMGFADRGLVSEALARGASACLDLPVDLADLARALDRLVSRAVVSRNEPGHPAPPRPRSAWLGVSGRSRRVAGRDAPT